MHQYLDLGLFWSKKLHVKFRRVLIGNKDTHYALISFVFSLWIIHEVLNVTIKKTESVLV